MREPEGFGSPQPGPPERTLTGPWFQVSGLGPPVAIAFARGPEGLVCTGLLVGWDGSGRAVTARALRRLRLPALLESFATLDGAAALIEVAPPAHSRALTPEHYARVAAEYTRAVADCPRAPVQRLCERLGTSPATAHRWLAVCRARGLVAQGPRRGPRL